MRGTTLILVISMTGCATLQGAETSAGKRTCDSMDAGDVVRILATTSLVKSAIPSVSGTHIFGTYAPERNEIWLNAAYDEPIRRLALIHELFHAKHGKHGPQEDSMIRVCAINAYIGYYGTDADLPEPLQRWKLGQWN